MKAHPRIEDDAVEASMHLSKVNPLGALAIALMVNELRGDPMPLFLVGSSESEDPTPLVGGKGRKGKGKGRSKSPSAGQKRKR